MPDPASPISISSSTRCRGTARPGSARRRRASGRRRAFRASGRPRGRRGGRPRSNTVIFACPSMPACRHGRQLGHPIRLRCASVSGGYVLGGRRCIRVEPHRQNPDATAEREHPQRVFRRLQAHPLRASDRDDFGAVAEGRAPATIWPSTRSPYSWTPANSRGASPATIASKIAANSGLPHSGGSSAGSGTNASRGRACFRRWSSWWGCGVSLSAVVVGVASIRRVSQSWGGWRFAVDASDDLRRRPACNGFQDSYLAGREDQRHPVIVGERRCSKTRPGGHGRCHPSAIPACTYALAHGTTGKPLARAALAR